MQKAVERVAAPAAGRRSRERSHFVHVVGRTLIYLTLILGAVWFLTPLFWMATSSLKPRAEIFQFPPVLFPLPPRWSNYANLFAQWPFWTYLRNTMIITVPSVIGQVISSSLVA